MRFFCLGLALLLVSCQTTQMSEVPPRSIDFYVYIPKLANAEKGDEDVETVFKDILTHLGPSSRWGRVGLAFNHPYTAFVSGETPENFVMKSEFKIYFERLIRVAHKMKIPILVGLNGGPWSTPIGPYNSYWKSVNQGQFLSRYQDGQVNQSIPKESALTSQLLQKYIAISPYNQEQKSDALVLTLSPFATELQNSRKKVLLDAVKFWNDMDTAYPNTLSAFTTDSEVSNFPFRFESNGESIPIGYESWNQNPFCQHYSIEHCSEFFLKKPNYSTTEAHSWFQFRADNHKKFVQDTVDTIRSRFPDKKIYTHQIAELDNVFQNHRQKFDFASPQMTSFVEKAIPGFTSYIYDGRIDDFKKIVDQISLKSNHWALMEFNTGKGWKKSKDSLAAFTEKQISYLFFKGVDAIAWLSWNTNSLDTGIKDSGVDEGIENYLKNGPRNNF